MEGSSRYIDVMQGSSGLGASNSALPAAHKFSTSVTTGQGGAYQQSWLGNGHTCTKLGNSRAPIPTCGIAVSRAGPNIKMVSQIIDGQPQPASAQVAEAIMANPDCRFSATQAKGSTESGSFVSTQDYPPLRHLSDLQHGSEEGSLLKSEASDIGSEDEDDAAGAESDDCGHTFAQLSSRGALKGTRKAKEKKKVGRPLAYKGDPNAPELTDAERRRIKRRIANRESARRVRHKRQEILEEMQAKMEHLQSHNIHLARHVQEAEAQRGQLYNQLLDLEGKHKLTIDDNIKMQQEIHALRESLQMKMSALEDELDKRAREVEDSRHQSAFGAASMQPARLPHPMSSSCLIDTEMGGDGSKANLEWFPSLTLDDMPHKAEALDMLSNFLREEPAQHQGETVC